MIQQKLKKAWLPTGILLIGILFSVFLWYLLTQQDLDSTPRLAESYHPWLVLIFGIFISILAAFSINRAHIARQRAISLHKTNQNLKKEVSERINAEEIKQKLEIALLQGQKLQAMGTLAGGIAHDFNNILYAIIGYTEMAREDATKDSQTYKNLGKILDAAHKGQELISRILAFSRRQHHDFAPIPLKNTIEAALALLKPTIPASVIIEFEPVVDSMILGNQTQIHQVLVNLINNAVDAMDSEGMISISMERIIAGDAFLEQFPKIQQQNYCKVEISDSGHGMDQHTMERIFEPFFTTKEVGKGTGLGLSIVHSIIKEHEGEVSVSSQLGKGTTFTLLLPELKE